MMNDDLHEFNVEEAALINTIGIDAISKLYESMKV